MNKEDFEALDMLYQQELVALDQQIAQKLKEDFGQEELEIHRTYIDQIRSSSSPAFGTYQAKDKAIQSSEVAYDHKTNQISQKISQREQELQKERDEILNCIYEFDGGSRENAVLAHNKFNEAQKETQPDVSEEKDNEINNVKSSKDFNDASTPSPASVEKNNGVDID